MKFKWHISLLLLAIILMFGCSKESTSGSNLPYFSAPVQVAAISAVNQDVTAGIIVIDPNLKDVSARFDWGDGTVTEYSDFVESGTAITAHHVYDDAGFYEIKAYAKNESNQETSDWSDAGTIQIVAAGEPYVQAIAQSKTEMTVGGSITVSGVLEEMSGFQVQARVDWADGVISEWSDITDPSTLHSFTHTYNATGIYQIKLQAKSSEDVLSVWYDTPFVLNVYGPRPENELVLIPAGTLLMGSSTTPALTNEGPIDTLEMDEFYMSKYEISQAEWVEIMGSNPSYFYGQNQEINAPVENIDWYDAIEYCNKRSIEEGLTPCYSIEDETNPANWPAGWHPAFPDTSAYQNQILCDLDATGYRLPTEAEWEYAAKGGGNTVYSGTNITAELGDYAWFGASPYQSHIVGIKEANAYGLYDMTGNIWEWTWNAYRLYPGNNAVLNAEARSQRIARGGGWNSGATQCRTSYRDVLVPSLKTFLHGLRVVKKA